jgi:lipoyl(octanoyl) transferase
MYNNTIQFISSQNLVNYKDAVSFMENRVSDIRNKVSDEAVWFLQHPSLYTAGTSAKDTDILDKNRFPVYHTGRGGQYTYHGPGQLIAYVMLDIQSRQIGIREYIQLLENAIIDTLAVFNVSGMIRTGRVGVWIEHDAKEYKIAAIGVRVRRGVTYHGIAININPDLTAFNSIVPCGISEYGVTSLQKIGASVTFQEVQNIFESVLIQNLTSWEKKQGHICQ